MLHRVWTLLRDTVEGYVNDGAMSRGAAIAYYTIFSIAPLLVIATAIAGLAFGLKRSRVPLPTSSAACSVIVGQRPSRQ